MTLQTCSLPCMRALVNIQQLNFLSGFSLCVLFLNNKTPNNQLKKILQNTNTQKRFLGVLFNLTISSSDSITRLSFFWL